MKSFRKILALALALVLGVSLCGCDLLALNEEKDALSTVATVGGEDYTKEQFLTFYNVVCLIYETGGYSVPTEEEDIKSYKQDILKQFATYKAMAKYVEDNELVSEHELTAEEEADEYIESLKENYTDGKYEELLSRYGFDAQSFTAALTEYMELSIASETYYSKNTDHSDLFEGVSAFSVDGTQIDLKEFYYYAVNMLFYNYLQSYSFPQSVDEMKSSFKDYKDTYYSYYYGIYNYGVSQGIELTDEEIEEGASTFDMIRDYMGEDLMNSYYEQFFLSEDDVAAARTQLGRVMAMYDKVSEQLEESFEPTDDEIREYYESNSSSFEETVSAYHILTEDEERAKELEKESKLTPEGFMKMYEKYSASTNTDESILEAADLGSFVFATMVPDFSTPVFDMQVGEVKGMIPTQFGYHLVYVYDRTEALTLEKDYDTIRDMYISANRSQYIYDRMEEITSSAKVTDGSYDLMPDELAWQMLEKKYSVKLYDKVAVR